LLNFFVNVIKNADTFTYDYFTFWSNNKFIYKKKSLAGLFLFGHGHGHTHSHDKEYEREEKKSSGEEDLIEQIKVMFFLF